MNGADWRQHEEMLEYLEWWETNIDIENKLKKSKEVSQGCDFAHQVKVTNDQTNSLKDAL